MSKTVLAALLDITQYEVSTGLADRLRIKTGMTPHVYIPATADLIHAEFVEHEADLIAKSLYDYAVMVNAKSYEEFAKGMEAIKANDRVTASSTWLAGLKANVAQIWDDSFTLPDLSKISKGHMAEAKEAIFTETCKGMATYGPEKAMKNAELVQKLTLAIAEDRNKKKAVPALATPPVATTPQA